MATTSPPPSAVPPASNTTSPPPVSIGSPPPSTSVPPPQNSPPPAVSPLPPQQPVASPPPPASSTPPPSNSSPPPPSPSLPATPPASSPPSNPSPPPPMTRPSPPLASSPPPPTNSSPPPESPSNSPPPPASPSPTDPSSPPPPSSQITPPPPPSNSSQKASPPPPVIRLAPPPPVTVPSSGTPSVNSSSPNVPNSSSSSDNSGIGVGGTIAIGLAVGIILLSLLGLTIWCLRKRKKKLTRLNDFYVMPSPIGSPSSDSYLIKTYSSGPGIGSSSGSDPSSPKDPGGLGNSRPWFSYGDLVKATNGFSENNLLGEGGFGAVYKGNLPDGREVAVKQLKIGGGQGEREFKAEVEIISRIHHRHLVSLVGYCISENQRLLVYEYVPNDTLYFHLHGKGSSVLDWATRIKVAAGAARGIAYLHQDCHPRIIHRDIKSSNILLDNNFEARVSDFGLAKLALDAETHVTTRVMGTFGYMAPEYATSGKLTEKSDVYSFGVVLLELITGRKSVDTSQPLGDESLVGWARPLMSHALDTGEYQSLADPRLGGKYVENEMCQMVEAAAACVRHLASKRPSMGQIVRAFDSLATADLSNGMKVGLSTVYNSAQQSEEIKWFRRMAFGSQNYSTDYEYSRGSETESSIQ